MQNVMKEFVNMVLKMIEESANTEGGETNV